ncbi:MAG: hypothetical protein HOC08_04535 [Deltaproteobacteria bacterium]|nr:hypothetical protein [Deltaproteobacteria bacterium]
MQSADEEDSSWNPNNGIPQDNRYCTESMNADSKQDATASEVPENLNSGKKSSHIKQADFFRNLLFGISIILVAGTAIFQLDLMPSVMLGCAVIGFNYYWTVKLVQKLLLERKLLALDLLFILTKFVISVIVLFGALNYLKLPPMGLLIGLSNVALAAIVYSFVRVMNPHKFA